MEVTTPFYRAIGLWSALKKKPICTTQLAHGVGENGVANWITAIAVVVNTDLVATGGNCAYFLLRTVIKYS